MPQLTREQLKLIYGIESIVGKKLNETEKQYVFQRLSRDDQEILPTDTKDEQERKQAIFFRDIIMRFMPDDDKRAEALENISHLL
jgi:hypothetical protein